MTSITVGLVNNMPDAALEATETQFSALLSSAAGPLVVELRLTSLPEVRRGAGAAGRIAATYWPFTRFLDDPPDALIVTGTEPIAADLREEPYWSHLTQLVDWSLTHTASSIWSCLAAHAAVQHLSQITRRRLPEKCCGIYEHVIAEHSLTVGIEAPLHTPHSRWNDLPTSALRAAGYEILSEAPSGANIFALENHGRPLVFLQGHPEYERETLAKEYRRDVGRFVRGQQASYPNLPRDYFPVAALPLLEDFRQRATTERRAEVMSQFPTEAVQSGIPNTWQAAATVFYRNWLQQIAAATGF